MKAYRIVQWREMHESAESRKLEQPWWYRKPNMSDGDAYSRVAEEPDGLALYGAWSVICDVASRGPRQTRGWLIRNGAALGAEDLVRLSRFHQREVFERALEFFTKLGWLKEEEFHAEAELPGMNDNRAANAASRPAQGAAASAAQPGAAASRPAQGAAASAANLPTEREREREVREKEGSVQRERRDAPRGAAEAPGGAKAASLAAVMASRTQAGVLLSEIKALDARKEALTGDERAELRKKRAALREVQKNQRQGNFAAVAAA